MNRGSFRVMVSLEEWIEEKYVITFKMGRTYKKKEQLIPLINHIKKEIEIFLEDNNDKG